MITSSPSPTISSLNTAPGSNPYKSPRSSVPSSPPRYRPRQPLPRRQPTTPTATSQSTPSTAPSPPRPQFVDAGTQYSPPDWPPTSSRSSLATARRNIFTIPTANPEPQSLVVSDTPKSAVPPPGDTPAGGPPEEPQPEPPLEPRLRVTPQSSLQNANATSTRRSRSSASEEGVSTEATAPGSARSSSPKRARQQSGEATVLPRDYSQCKPRELAALIADMLMELIRFNDEIPLRDGQLTRFHSRAPPGISVHDYLQRLTFHASLPPPILLSMVYYIDKLCALYPSFTINSLTVHRFLITAATVASKGLSDAFWTNSLYAQVGGVSVRELALLELELLTRMQWRIVPSPEDLEAYYRSLVQRSGEYVVAEADDNEDNNNNNDEPETESDEQSTGGETPSKSSDTAADTPSSQKSKKESKKESKDKKRRSGSRLSKLKAVAKAGDTDVTMSN